MSTAVIESIAANILTTVNTVTTANGYAQDLAGIRPARLPSDDEVHDNGTVLVLQGETAEDDELSAQGNEAMKAWRQLFVLIAYVIASDSETAALDTRLNEVRGDLEKALMADPTRGGYAIDTVIRAPERFQFDAAVTGIVVACEVLYRTRIDDPFTAA